MSGDLDDLHARITARLVDWFNTTHPEFSQLTISEFSHEFDIADQLARQKCGIDGPVGLGDSQYLRWLLHMFVVLNDRQARLKSQATP